MNSKIILFVLGLVLSIGTIQAQVARTFNVATAGTLSTLINSSKKDSITSLTLTGNLNGDDIRYIREMAGSDVYGQVTSGTLSVLDMSGANIVSGGSFYRFSNLGEFYTSDSIFTESMFNGCLRLTSITIPNSLISLSRWAFNNCSRLTQIVVYSSNNQFSSLDGVLFNKNKSSLITYPEGKSGQYTIPGSVTSIGEWAFYNCKGLTSVTIPSSVTNIELNAFTGCTGLTSVSIPNSVTFLGNEAFSRCIGLTSVTISTSVISIRWYTFSFCIGLTSITIPNSVTNIGPYAFYWCTKLTSVTIPNSVTNIGPYAFSCCKRLTEIHSQKETPPSLFSNVFDDVNIDACKLYVPKGSSPLYRAAYKWGDFANIVEEDITPINKISLNNTSVCTIDNAIIVQNAKSGQTISVYTPSGALLRTVKATDDYIKIEVSENQIYLVKIANDTYKVALN